MKYARIACAVTITFILCTPLCFGAGLKEYVAKPDSSYKYTIHSTAPVLTNTVHFVQLTSQTWRGIVWKHWLIVIQPKEVKFPDKALLLISGGSNTGELPDMESDEARVLSVIAEQLKSVVAILMQVPNEPLFDGKTEDGIIAYTFEQFLRDKEGGDDWPLLLPMVKSAVRAMDTVQSIAKEKFNQEVKQFVVTGASKRGWTTWLTAVADPRVSAIMPMVIDVLNMGKQMAHQKKVYGAYSEEVKDYTDRHIQEYMQSPDGKRLLDIVDPYSYREQLTLPKLVILGTNDEYWTADSSTYYFPDLRGPKALHYEPNAGHGLSLGIVPSIMAFYHAQLTGKKFPELNWRTLEDGTFEVTWDDPKGSAALWSAQSPNRDFRHSKWTSEKLPGDRKATIKVPVPEKGWGAYYVAVTFPADFGDVSPGTAQGVPPLQVQHPLSTTITVVPDTYPDHTAAAATAK